MRAALIALLVGCGGGAYTCEDSVFADSIYSSPVDCSESQSATALAAQILTDSGWWPHPQARLVELEVRDKEVWIDANGRSVAGQTVPLGVVRVGSSRRALVHELLHVRALQELDFEASHREWQWDGRHALSNLYAWALLSEVRLDGGGCGSDPAFPALITQSLEAAGWGPTIASRATAVAQGCSHAAPVPSSAEHELD